MLLDSQINHPDAFSEGLSNGFEMPSQKGWDLTKSILRQLTEVEGSSCTHARHSMIQPTSGSMLYKVEHVSLIQSKMTKLPLSVHISSLGLDGKAVHTVGLSATSIGLLLYPQIMPEVWSLIQTGALLNCALHPTCWKHFPDYITIHLPSKCPDFEERCLTEISYTRYSKPSSRLI